MKPTEHLSRNTEAVVDILAAMIKRELSEYSSSSRGGYLDHPSYPTMVTAVDRAKLVDWCYDIIDHCQLSRGTVASAMEMVDRFLSLTSNSTDADAARVSDEALEDQSKFQLLAVTALYVSVKLNEKEVIPSDKFSSEVCHHVYSAKEIEDMERILLSGLSWRCHAPTAYQVGLSILSLLLPYVDMSEATWGFLMEEMKYLTELAVRDYYFSKQRTSTIALAAILNAIGDMTATRLKDRLGACLGVIMECFEFDHPTKIAVAMTRLKILANSPELLDDMDVDMDDERSFDDVSITTRKVSNTSTQMSVLLECHSVPRRPRGDSSGNVSDVSPRSSLRDIFDQDLYDLSCDDHYAGESRRPQ